MPGTGLCVALRFRGGVLLLLALGSFALARPVQAETIARVGEGFLERIDGQLVLHVAGTPWEMGYQHGALLKDHIRESVHFLFEVKAAEVKIEAFGLKLTPRHAIDMIVAYQRRHMPEKYLQELEGLAAGADLPLADAAAANFIPELFHCSGFAVMNSATEDGVLYHGRVLDYATDWKLQEHAVLIVAKPAEGIPFVNVSYAGFIGSVTGMNAEHVSIGEMGGAGLGHWDGVPMSFLVRMALEESDSLDEALATFRDRPRTCEYYYVIADGEDNRAVGLAAHWNTFEIVKPGEAHPRLNEPVKDTVLLSAGDRYKELARRARENQGKIDAKAALGLMDCPVAMKSNLHSVLFEPRGTRFWVAHATADGKPAATQPYHEFRLTDLLAREPDPSVRTIAAVPAR